MKRAAISQPPAQPPLQAAVAALAQPSARRAEIALRYLDVTRREKLTRTERAARDAASAEVLSYLSPASSAQPEPVPMPNTVPVVVSTPSGTSETLHLNGNLWFAFLARCEAQGKDPGAVLDARLRAEAKRQGLTGKRSPVRRGKAVRK